MKKKIVEGAIALSSGEACLKQKVYAMLVTKDGQEFYGSNEMKACVSICPREELNIPTGQGYYHCKDTCKQDFHAEHEAVDRAKKLNVCTKGSTMNLVGHHYCCDNCLSIMKNAGVQKVVYVEENNREQFLN